MALRDKRATASYNFVPLPATVIKSPIDGGAENDAERQANYKEYVKKHGKLSGYIELHCRTMTPVFIGMGDKEGAFFAPAGKPILPGSTLRGMVKNIFKIVTCGAMRTDKDSADIDDRALYYRSFMNKSYKAELVDSKKIDGKHQSFTKAKPGFLIHDKLENQYYICPAQFDRKKDTWLVSKYKKVILWDEYEKRGGELPCFTGPMEGGRTAKTHYTFHYNPDWSSRNRLPVSEEIIVHYQHDLTRDEDLDLFKLAKRGKAAASFVGDDGCDFVVPCFYKEKKGEVAHFGFGQYYRIPYPYTIGGGGHLPRAIKDASAAVDYADAIFGRKELWGSRLAFEDAVLKESKGFETAHYSKTLGEPKPTSYQLYLEQEGEKADRDWGSENAPIRGYKLYWHQAANFPWRKDEAESKDNVDRKIRPLKAGSVFEGRIRFKNFSEVELGALLKVFSLAAEDRELCFKIGQGKGIGLGSVRIDAELVLIDEVQGYAQLFAENGDWNTAEKKAPMEEYLKAFDDVIERLDEKERTRYELSQQALLDLLDWKAVEQRDWTARTRQMTLGSDKNPDEAFDKEVKQFRNRWVLPTAHEVYSEGEGK